MKYAEEAGGGTLKMGAFEIVTVVLNSRKDGMCNILYAGQSIKLSTKFTSGVTT